MDKNPNDKKSRAPGGESIAFRELKGLPLAETGGKGRSRGFEFRNMNVPVGHALNESGRDEEDLAFRDMAGMAGKYPEREKRLGRAKELYLGAEVNLLKIFYLIKHGKPFTVEPMLQFANDFVAGLLEEADSWMQLLYKKERNDSVMTQIATHSLNVAIIAIRIGIGLKLSHDELTDIALRAFFHDVGMLRTPPEVLNKPGKLTPEEISLIQQHPRHGYEILSGLEGEYRVIADVIYQEHERHDGSGYPKGLSNGAIFDYSLIIGISDMYVAMVHPRPYRSRHLPFDAVKLIIATAKDQFPKSILKALVNDLSAFPKGIYVRFNSNEVGRVVATNKLAPLRPVVEIFQDPVGRKMRKTRIVDLANDQVLSIETAYFEEEGK